MWQQILDLSFLEKVLLLEMPKGFALFNIHDDILNSAEVFTHSPVQTVLAGQ
jgi:hypothetical protein